MPQTTEERIQAAMQQLPKGTLRQIAQTAKVPISAVLQYFQQHGLKLARPNI
jgi:DNA-binding transcriptional regulator YbjK